MSVKCVTRGSIASRFALGSLFSLISHFPRFKRRWNRDRHKSLQHTDSGAECAFRDCKKEFTNREDLDNHEESEHGLPKKPKVGVRHDDHYDILLPSGKLF